MSFPKREPDDAFVRWQKEIIEAVADGRLQSYVNPKATPITRETLYRAREEMERQMSEQPWRVSAEEYARTGSRSFIKPELEHRIIEWCRQDWRVDLFWREFTGRVRGGLNDTIVESLMQVLSHLLRQWDSDKDQLNTRNLDNIRTLGTAAHDVVTAFEDAKSRGDLNYMEAAIEELDAALYETKYGEATP